MGKIMISKREGGGVGGGSQTRNIHPWKVR